MALKEKYIIVPFRKGARGVVVPGELRQASNEASAERIAKSMSEYMLGASAIAVYVDEETGDMTSPRLIAEFGQALNVIEDMAA